MCFTRVSVDLWLVKYSIKSVELVKFWSMNSRKNGGNRCPMPVLCIVLTEISSCLPSIQRILRFYEMIT